MSQDQLKINFLDCLLRGKFTRAGEASSQLFLKDISHAQKCALERYLNCELSRSRSSGVHLKFGISVVHLKSAIKASRAIIDCMSDSDPKLYFRFSNFQLFSIFRSLCSIPYSNFIKILKYFTAYPLALHLNNDLPEAPVPFDTKYPMVGNNSIRRWWKERMFSKSHSERNLTLFWSLLQGVKRACEFADDSFILSSMEKHKQLLSREHPIDESLESRYWDNFDTFFRRFKPEENLKYEISNSACWERTRSQGGARAEILDEVNGLNYVNPCFPTVQIINRIAHNEYKINDMLYRMVETSPGVIKELRGVRVPSFQDLEEMSTDTPRAMVQAILEPLKVRLITKGPASNYFLAKSYQKSLFKYLRKFPQFELIGDPLRDDHIYRMIERERAITGMDFSHFVSGDYSSATDNLGIQYTIIGMNSSLQNYKGPYKTILKSVLFEHEIHYPNKFGIDSFNQNNGQLMGSPLSFPFLCTTNLIAYKLSLEDYLGRKLRFKDLPCLVNGDDILFRTNPDHYEIWKKHVADIGFTLSVGKNYIHEKVLTINSTMYKFQESRLKRIDYCNFGLLSGTSKLGASRGEVREKAIELADAFTKSVGGATNKPLAASRFFVRNSESIAKITMRGRYNLFIPRALGGLGFPIYSGVNFHVTRFQRLLAKLVLKSKDLCPLFGFKTSSKSNMVMGYESKNSKSLMCGMGPLRQNEREISIPQFTEPNSCYQPETTTRWFTKIPQRYNAAKLFPFRLAESDEIDLFADYRMVESF